MRLAHISAAIMCATISPRGWPMWCAAAAAAQCVGERAAHIVAEELGEPEHLAMSGLDAPESVLAAQGQAALVVCPGRDHPAADIVGVAETAQRRGLVLRRAAGPGKGQALAVVMQAARDVAAREAEIAGKEVGTRPNVRETEPGRGRSGEIQVLLARRRNRRSSACTPRAPARLGSVSHRRAPASSAVA